MSQVAWSMENRHGLRMPLAQISGATPATPT
jgi:hypothetical protein